MTTAGSPDHAAKSAAASTGSVWCAGGCETAAGCALAALAAAGSEPTTSAEVRTTAASVRTDAAQQQADADAESGTTGDLLGRGDDHVERHVAPTRHRWWSAG
jgi:hypothetical protein